MGTTAIQIPKAKWQQFFDDLGRQYYGWAVTVEILAGELGDQQGVADLPLQGLSYEAKGGSQAGDILVATGDAGTPYVTHLIRRPRSVLFTAAQPGAEADVEIESEEGITTVVRIRMRPGLPPPANPRQSNARESNARQSNPRQG